MKIGVLLIGSLYWCQVDYRRKWREERLELGKERFVRAPIRYGRRSVKRKRCFTMVFSTSLNGPKLGQAIWVPCKSQDLIDEAVRLWTAESSDGKNAGRRISNSWGCVGLLENPSSRMPISIRKMWIEKVGQEGAYGELDSVEGEKAAVNGDGFLNIAWPETLDGSPIESDVLLATATKPTIVEGNYGSAREIAEAWNTEDGKNEVYYFWNNRDSEIKTFEDDEIIGLLNVRRRPG